VTYLLDTCVLSEFTRRQPNPRVSEWIDSVAEDSLFLSAITIGEIQRGVARLAESRRKTELQTWLNEALLARFAGRTLPLDDSTLLTWGMLCARLENAGHPIGVMDGLIAATVLQHNLTLVTRNTSDFSALSIQMLNPWQ
jgi:predicted nucleic acid-binding protein